MNEDNILSRIRVLANEKGMSISEIERKSDLGNGVIRRWDESVPTADKLQRVAVVLGTTIEFLLLGEDKNQNQKAKILAREANDLSDSQLDVIRSMIREFEKQNK